MSLAFGDVDRYDVLDLVDHLADKSLVALDGVDPAGESRYRLLETIRYYALDRLDDAGELVAARDAHAEFWAGWAQTRNVHFDCSLTILDAIPPDLANLTAAARWACVNRPELLQALMLCIGPFVQLDDGEHRGDGLFESALAALEGRDDIAWAHVAMAAEFARAFTWVVVADEELRLRTEALATEHDLVLIRANLAFLSAFVTTKDLGGFAVASELFDEAGSPSWGSLARAIGVRWAAATGRLAAAEELLAAERHVEQRPHAGGDRRRRGPGRARARRARRNGAPGAGRVGEPQTTEQYEDARRSRTLAYESVARVAFFSGDRDVLAWAAAALSEGAKSKVTRRLATVAAAHLSVLEDVSPVVAGGRVDPS